MGEKAFDLDQRLRRFQSASSSGRVPTAERSEGLRHEDLRTQRLVPPRRISFKTVRSLSLLLAASVLLLVVLVTEYRSRVQEPGTATSSGGGQVAETVSAERPPAAAPPTVRPAAPEIAGEEETRSPSSSRREEPVEPADSLESLVARERSARQAVARATESWARAWSEQRVDEYVGSYSANFEPPRSLDLAAWRSQRRRRILASRYIRVTLKNLVVEFQDDHHATASFSQVYESDSFGDEVRKSLSWIREGAGWKIVAEATLSD